MRSFVVARRCCCSADVIVNAVLLVLVATHAIDNHAATANQVVAPGSVTSYTGQGSRRRSYGTVRDPAAGFFVAGSSLEGLNGVYVRAHPQVFDGFLAGPAQHKVHLSYYNDDSRWYMMLVEPTEVGMPIRGRLFILHVTRYLFVV